MNTEHTPGPWKVIEAYPGTRKPYEPKSHLEVVEAHDSDLVVCRFYSALPQNRQDARLIAAAPDLLEACRAAVKHTYPNLADADDLTDGDSKCWDMLMAAIAKAAGEEVGS